MAASINHTVSRAIRSDPGLPGKAYLKKPITKVLVLFTGGTIGMVPDDDGVYSPTEPKCLEKKLKEMAIFNCQITKNAIANYLEARHLECFLVLRPSLNDKHVVTYKIQESVPLLDSSNMAHKDWMDIATEIKKNYDDYDGFVVLHGTDTMVYTASALSFMCENLTKPVILTGSQIPIFETRSDGRNNFLDSLIIAGNYKLPEVMICFNGKVLRGNRCVKFSSGSFAAFTTPHMAPLVTLGTEIKGSNAAVVPAGTPDEFTITGRLCTDVVMIQLFPGITADFVRGTLSPSVKGAVVLTYGGGNAPSNVNELLDAFREACNRGVLIVNISQCSQGNVVANYATCMSRRNTGVIGGADMTQAAALTKLSYILGKEGLSLDHRIEMMTTNLRGEITIVDDTDLTTVEEPVLTTVEEPVLTTVEEPDLHTTDPQLIESLVQDIRLNTNPEPWLLLS